MEELRRIDPKGCGCTDCITGYSKPIDECTQEQLYLMHLGIFDNASGEETVITTIVTIVSN